MANIKSQKKRIITAEKARKRNQAVKSELKTAVRAVREAVAAGNGVEAYTKAQHACRLLDKAASKGIIHKNQAANRKSGVMQLANTVTARGTSLLRRSARRRLLPPKGGTKKAAAKAARKRKLTRSYDAEKAKRREATLKGREEGSTPGQGRG